MQNAKDTFYEVVRSRLAAVNPERTTVLRGVTRPGVLVEENELLSVPIPPDCFRLVWTDSVVEAEGSLPMVTQHCELRYETAGTALAAGMDRGRLLTAMDAELLAVLTLSPQRAQKTNYAALPSGGSAVAMADQIWWGAPVFGETKTRGERVAHVATVVVMSFQDGGER